MGVRKKGEISELYKTKDKSKKIKVKRQKDEDNKTARLSDFIVILQYLPE